MSRIFAGLLTCLAILTLAGVTLVPEVASAQGYGSFVTLKVSATSEQNLHIQRVWAFTTVGPGKLLMWKYDSVVARTFKPCTNTVAQTVTDSLYWGPFHRLEIKSKADTGWVQACTALVTGLDSTSTAVTDTIIIADNDTLAWSVKTWSKVRTVKFKHTHATDSAAFYGYPINCVVPGDGSKVIYVAGVAYDSMVGKAVYSSTGVDGYGIMVTKGLWSTYLVAGVYRAGIPLVTTATPGSGGVYSSGSTNPGAVFGKCAYAGVGGARVPVWVNCE